jgi:WD40 repeat protein
MNQKHLRLGALVAAALSLGACTSGGGGSSVSLPQRFRMSQSQLGTFFEVRSGRIAIVRSDGNVVLTDQTGEKIVPLTDDAGFAVQRDGDGVVGARYVMPMWAPDGKRLALLEVRSAQPVTAQVQFEGDLRTIVEAGPGSGVVEQTLRGAAVRPIEETERFGFEPGRVTIDFAAQHVDSALYTVAPDGPGPLKEVWYGEEPVAYVDWSPQGNALAVLTSGDEEAVTLVPLDGGRRRSLAQGANLSWNWKPDGATMLMRSATGVTVRTVETGDAAARLERTATASQYSPDGRSMIFVRVQGGESALILADADGKEQRELASARGEMRFAWSPIGDRVAYVAREDGNLAGPLRVVDVKSGEPRLLSTAPVEGFFWSPDGKRIAAFAPLNLSSLTEDDQTPSAVSESSANPMALWTLEVEQGPSAARKVLYLEPTARFRAVLRDFDRFARSMSIWSPNSRRLVVPFTVSVGAGGSADYIVETEASGSIWPRVLGEGSLAVWSPN